MAKANKSTHIYTTDSVLSNKQKKRIAEYAAAVAIKTVDRERERAKRMIKDRRLRNTKLLLKNYRALVDHCENAISATADIDPDQIVYEGENIEQIMGAILYDDNLRIESIQRSIVRTRLIVSHVKEMLNLYSLHCASSLKPEEQRRYNVIYWRYLAEQPMTAAEVAGQFNIDARTVYKDINIAAERLSALFFGVDGLNHII